MKLDTLVYLLVLVWDFIFLHYYESTPVISWQNNRKMA